MTMTGTHIEEMVSSGMSGKSWKTNRSNAMAGLDYQVKNCKPPTGDRERLLVM
jgi:hypothetical protein